MTVAGRVRWLALVSVTLVTAVAVAAVAVWGTLRTYRVLTRRDLVAVVECWPSPSRADEYRLVYRPAGRGPASTRGSHRPVSAGRLGPAQVYQLYGDQWSVGGDVLIWRGWAQLLGLKTCYKVTRIEGRYENSQREIAETHLVYDVDGGSDWLWRFLYRAQAWLPGVEAVYGSAVYLPADPHKQFVVYATPSGFLIKPQRRAWKYPSPDGH